MTDDKLAAFLAELKTKAEKATPGKRLWHKSGALHVAGSGGYAFGEAVLRPTWEYDEGVDIKGAPEDIDFVEAFDPQVALALVRVAEIGILLGRHEPRWCGGCDSDGRDLEGGPHQPDCHEQAMRDALADLRRLAEERAA
jgi:hypothetical protein